MQQRNVIWLGLERILKILFSLVATFYVARELGAEKFGALNYIMGIVLIISTISNLGFDSLLVKEVVLQDGAKRKLVFNCFKLKLAVMTISLIGLLSSLMFFEVSELERSIAIPFILVLFLSSLQVFEFYFLSVIQSRFSVSAYFWGGIVSNLSKIIGLSYGLDVKFIAYMFVVEYFISGLLMLFYFFKSTESDSAILQPGTMRAILKDSLPLVLAGVSVMIYMKVDQIMLRGFLGLKEVGEYSAAVKLSEGVYFIPVVIVGSYFSKWVKQQKNGEDYFMSVNKILSLLIFIALAYTVFIWLFGDYFVTLIFGPEYQSTFSVLKIHTFSAYFVFIGVVASKLLILEKLEKIVFYTSLLGAVLNIGLNIFLIPRFAGTGAAVATVLSHFMSGYFSLFFFTSSRPVAIRLTKALMPLWLFQKEKVG